MAKLWFRYATMNSGKSTYLLQAAYNYYERGMTVDIFKPAIDTREERFVVRSRIGLEKPAIPVGDKFSFFAYYGLQGEKFKKADLPSAIFVDEAQFLEPFQVHELRSLVNDGTPVVCYGLRTDFQQNLFPGSRTLLALADELRESTSMCWCGDSAKFVLRLDSEGKVQTVGPQVLIGGNESYVPVCGKHWERLEPRKP